ncbi:DUF6804 family protein [Pedobacter agri]|uniref:DUF6804 family protein n=1 Tax=Pedobacter agri TaxID=454586 RepID=UPI003977B31E
MVNISMTVCIALLFFNLPYSYFEFVRFMVLIGGIFNALVYTRYQRTASVLLSSIMVIMFNPLIPFSFDRSEWLKLDVLVLCALAVLTSLDFKELRVENKSDV